MRLRSIAVVCLFLASATAMRARAEARAADRLPERLRKGFELATGEVRRYIDYIMVKVWKPRVLALAAQKLDPAARQREVDAMTDEVVHILLPRGRRLLQDVVFGTGSTHLGLTMAARRKALGDEVKAALKRRASGADAMNAAVEQASNIAERELNDRLEQALLEEMEDYVQRGVEGATGLPERGRPRDLLRPLPEAYAGKYEAETRAEVERFNYWWLRKRKRMWLTHTATSTPSAELDRARHEGLFWRPASGISYEAWAQNRLRLDHKWGRLDWEIDRRRIRRRMDQDLARSTWAMTRIVKELMRPETRRELEEHLQKRVREELEKPETRPKAEQFPRTREELKKQLEGLKAELDPLMDRAMGRAPIPGDMRGLAHEHGRRFMREEMMGSLGWALNRAAAPMAAGRAGRDQVPGLVSDALATLDPGGLTPEEYRKRALAHAKEKVTPRLRKAVSDALAGAGLDRLTVDGEERTRLVDEAIEKSGASRAIEHEVEKQLGPIERP